MLWRAPGPYKEAKQRGLAVNVRLTRPAAFHSFRVKSVERGADDVRGRALAELERRGTRRSRAKDNICRLESARGK